VAAQPGAVTMFAMLCAVLSREVGGAEGWVNDRHQCATSFPIPPCKSKLFAAGTIQLSTWRSSASFGFLDLAPSILHSNWFWDYIS
jgi:hypothetical protein